MKFRYKNYGHGVLRPVIPIVLRSRGRWQSYEVLVDSGADSCVFDADIAEVLSIPLTKGELRYVGGITGSVETYYVHPVTLIVGGLECDIQAGFLSNIAPTGYGIVGQRGFFDLFVVKFDLLKEEVELVPRKNNKS